MIFRLFFQNGIFSCVYFPHICPFILSVVCVVKKSAENMLRLASSGVEARSYVLVISILPIIICRYLSSRSMHSLTVSIIKYCELRLAGFGQFETLLHQFICDPLCEKGLIRGKYFFQKRKNTKKKSNLLTSLIFHLFLRKNQP